MNPDTTQTSKVAKKKAVYSLVKEFHELSLKTKKMNEALFTAENRRKRVLEVLNRTINSTVPVIVPFGRNTYVVESSQSGNRATVRLADKV